MSELLDLTAFELREAMAAGEISSVDAVRQAAMLGAAGILIWECFTDLISPQAYKTFSVPYMRQVVEECRNLGIKSIYGFAGNPAGKLDAILSIGADALAFEESKKNFVVDINQLAEYIDGRCTLFGNLDAIGVLQDGSEAQLRDAIAKQITAGRRNRNRFVVSLGSPVTPATLESVNQQIVLQPLKIPPSCISKF